MTPTKFHELKVALDLYTGELLEEFYDDWALRERERLRALYLSSLKRLMEYYQQQGTYAESLSCGQLILQYDPLREDIHRALMRLHSEHGQRGHAVRQYEVCRAVLAAELGVVPLEETQALFAQIVLPDGSRQDAAESGNWDGEPTNLQQALHQVQAAMQSLDLARERLQRAVQRVQYFANDRGDQ
jgi:DNA-binding SARP family transcriptional activator